MTRSLIPAAFAVGLLLGPAMAAAQAPQMPELTERQLLDRAAMNGLAVFTAALADALARGESAREWGTRIGERFATGWGADQTPQSMVRGMWANFLSIEPGIALEVGDYSDDVSSIRLPPDFPSALEDPERWYGVTREQYRTAFEGAVGAIAGKYGLKATVEGGPDALVFTVRR